MSLSVRIIRVICLLGVLTPLTVAEAQYIRRDRGERTDRSERAVPVITDPVPVREAPREPSPTPPETTAPRQREPTPRPAPAQRPAPAEPAEEVETVPEPPEDRIDISADRLEFDADRQLMIGVGNVVVTQFGDELRADYIEVHTETREAKARGDVFFQRGDRIWEGEELAYNFRTREGDFGDFLLFTDPFYISARESQQVGRDVIHLRSARLTTCSGDQRQEFTLRARQATITDGSVLRARHVVAHLYGVPIFYTPYLKKDFERDSNVEIMPGYSSRMGPFVLTAYNWYPTPDVKASTQLDYRTKRGVGVGQRVRWRLPENNAQGRFQAYYINDDRPIRSESQRRTREGLVDSDRYWIGLRHGQAVGDRNYFMSDVNYVSDPFMLEDFFDREFRRGVQPENRVALIRRDNRYTAGLLFNFRLNDFFENVNRLPELSLDINRFELGTSGFYYESEHRGSYLERVFPEQGDREDYDSVRVDTLHQVLYPMRHFGFLSVVPSVAYRGTWYSSTPDPIVFIDVEPLFDEDGDPLVDEDGVVLFEETERVEISDGGAVFRSLFEFGIDTSFKAFRVINERPNYLGSGLRHIAEPYARYTLVPEPSEVPGDLYQFDRIDSLDERHEIRFGIRNKLQTRRTGGRPTQDARRILDDFDLSIDVEDEEEAMQQAGRRTRIHDFIDINMFTIFRIDPDEDENDFDDFFFDARLRLADWIHVDFDGAYDWYENEMRLFNTQLHLYARDRSRFSVEYRYNRDRRQTVQPEVVLFPRARWSYRAYWRYDIEESDLEEQSYMIQRRFDCTKLALGVRGRADGEDDTEWRAWAQVTLLAFPDSELRIGR